MEGKSRLIGPYAAKRERDKTLNELLLHSSEEGEMGRKISTERCFGLEMTEGYYLGFGFLKWEEAFKAVYEELDIDSSVIRGAAISEIAKMSFRMLGLNHTTPRHTDSKLEGKSWDALIEVTRNHGSLRKFNLRLLLDLDDDDLMAIA
ncbi:hypothetical protein EJ110_NYTH37462 [Nymphaea thermarum]|nr:hypothetical protein EJ110_NYTH37462 [Nymphaea thermarum]